MHKWLFEKVNNLEAVWLPCLRFFFGVGLNTEPWESRGSESLILQDRGRFRRLVIW